MTRAVAIGLKIPDNTAFTAAVALRGLGIAVERVERSEIWFFEDDGSGLVDRVKADETIFNPNKHYVTVLDEPAPRSGEVWIEPLSVEGWWRESRYCVAPLRPERSNPRPRVARRRSRTPLVQSGHRTSRLLMHGTLERDIPRASE